MEEFIQNFYTFRYSRNQSVYTSDSEDKEEDDYRFIVLEPQNEEDEERKMSIRLNQFRNQQGHTCSYYNRLINSIFVVLF